MGDFILYVFNDLVINVVKSLIDCGVKIGRIIQNYVLKGYCDVGQILCLGDKLYVLINIWFYYYYQKMFKEVIVIVFNIFDCN